MSMNFKWKKEYELDLPEIDVQHKRFLSLVKMLSISDEISRHTILNEIFRYASYHFKSEEEMMKQYDYTGLSVHSEEHQFLKERVIVAIEDSQKGKLDFESFIMFLVKWFVNHTTLIDRKMSESIIEKRI
jgi:hemerythrin